MQNLCRGLQAIGTNPNAAFSVKEGCQTLYDGIANYIGAANIMMKATVQKVKRHDYGGVTIQLSVGNETKEIECDKLIIAFPQVVQNLAFLDLTNEEKSLFQNVETRDYFSYRIDVTGGSLQNLGPWNIFNINPTNPYQLPTFPCAIFISRMLAYGPYQGWATSLSPISDSDMQNIIVQQLAKLPSDLVIATLATDTPNYHHQFQPHFNLKGLSGHSPYTTLDHLQGKKSTFWTGALASFGSSSQIWQRTYTLIEKHFPKKVYNNNKNEL